MNEADEKFVRAYNANFPKVYDTANLVRRPNAPRLQPEHRQRKTVLGAPAAKGLGRHK